MRLKLSSAPLMHTQSNIRICYKPRLPKDPLKIFADPLKHLFSPPNIDKWLKLIVGLSFAAIKAKKTYHPTLG